MDAGLTISGLARRAGVTRDTISHAERGRHSLQATTLAKLARALGMTPSELLAQEEKLALKADHRSSVDEPSFYDFLEGERLSKAVDPMTEAVGALVEVYEPILRGLPEQPTGEEYLRALELFAPLFRRAARIGAKVQAAGLDEDPNALRGAAADKVREIHAAVDRLYELKQEAWVWRNRVPELEKVHGPGQLEAQTEDWQREDVEATERRERLG
jgi:transcriptional regulator with XRE-family HTH domain